MEKEQIIKALECCTRGRKSNEDIPCLECPYNECNIVGGTSERQTSGTCQGWLMKDAIALINELTEENEKIKSIDISKDIVIESLAEENERLKAEVSVKKKLLDKCVDLEDRVRADTVREFANRLKAVCWSCIMTPRTIDRIAEEILEE